MESCSDSGVVGANDRRRACDRRPALGLGLCESALRLQYVDQKLPCVLEQGMPRVEYLLVDGQYSSILGFRLGEAPLRLQGLPQAVAGGRDGGMTWTRAFLVQRHTEPIDGLGFRVTPLPE